MRLSLTADRALIRIIVRIKPEGNEDETSPNLLANPRQRKLCLQVYFVGITRLRDYPTSSRAESVCEVCTGS